ncbi:hypothetical protein FPQ18DRAFT_354149 [Pyronema domesticum]|uniref:Uncharacterized protein n=1 Tax=Pyronema omphalodes (strain CBS 100304) TaxID=1076935 RepID=U4KWY7_PYROM|nr:hypothetical protein FPQ18DRAFT_354149 [Pyronema domesticum]CCX06211.1 Similar to hypothetical protein [Tuber melanosporum Mel28]; acc. no. XP_002840059 [Pyronema omphalodes CBS 100304]
MDFYNQPVPGTYTVDWKQWFDLPNEDGSYIKVIPVTSKQASFWVVAYAIIVTLIFAAVLRMVIDLVLAYFPLANSGNRVIMLVAFYNANNPTTAALMMLDYVRRSIFSTRKKTEDVPENEEEAKPDTPKPPRQTDWSTLYAALALMLIAATVVGGSMAAQFVVSAKQLTKRHATRASPDSIFYPNFTEVLSNKTTSAFNKIKPIRASAGFQALGRYETSRTRLADRVKLQTIEGMSGDNITREYNYNYYLTGYEMGLQYAPTLRYEVTGNCKTDYSMYSINRNGDREWYTSDPDFSEGFTPVQQERMIPYLNTNPKQASGANGQTIYQNPDDIARDGYLFTIVPYTAGRFTYRNTTNTRDPWYLTEVNPIFNSSRLDYRYQFGGFYHIKRGRPALRCSQRDDFSMNGVTVGNAYLLSQIPGLKISEFLRDQVLTTEFGTSPIVQLTRNLGYNSLASAVFYDPPSSVFDVSQANMTEDIFKLVALQFLYSREAVRNIPLLYSAIKTSGLNITNLAAVNGVVPYENADIILETSEVAALSVLVLIITPIICALVWILITVRRFGFQPAPRADNQGPLARLNLHTIGLQATQLYRCLDETVSGQRKWAGRLSMTPYIKEVDEANRKRNSKGDLEEGPEPEPFVLPKLVPVSRPDKRQSTVSNQDSKTQDTNVDEVRESEEDGPTSRRGSRINSDGKSLKGNQQYDIVLTNRPPAANTGSGSSHVKWGNIGNIDSNIYNP